MTTTVIIVLTIVIVVGVFILDHFAIQREKEQQEAARKAREERRAAKAREQELETVKASKAAKASEKEAVSNARKETADGRTVDLRSLNNITFACDAGMGTSAMGAVVLQRKLEAAGLNNVVVSHCSVSRIPEDARYIVCPKELAVQVADAHRTARIIPIEEFMDAPEYMRLNMKRSLRNSSLPKQIRMSSQIRRIITGACFSKRISA